MRHHHQGAAAAAAVGIVLPTRMRPDRERVFMPVMLACGLADGKAAEATEAPNVGSLSLHEHESAAKSARRSVSVEICEPTESMTIGRTCVVGRVRAQFFRGRAQTESIQRDGAGARGWPVGCCHCGHGHAWGLGQSRP